jgi:hypothetical protein
LIKFTKVAKEFFSTYKVICRGHEDLLRRHCPSEYKVIRKYLDYEEGEATDQSQRAVTSQEEEIPENVESNGDQIQSSEQSSDESHPRSD